MLTMCVQGIIDYCLFRPNAQGITFVASKLVVQSFLCALNAVQRNNSEFRGENRQ